MLNRTAEYFNQAIWDVIAKYYPAAEHETADGAPAFAGRNQGASAGPFASSVSLSNYDYMVWNSTKSGCVPDRNGNPYCQDGYGAVQGNAAAPSLYMGFSGSGGLRDYLQKHFNLSGSYPQTPYNAMRWNVMQHRSLALASMAPNRYSPSEDVPLRPWVAFKSFGGSLTNASDYYQEALLHFLLAGSDDLNFWNPDELMHPNDTSNLEFARTMTEASWAVGCEGRRWAWPDPRSPAVASGPAMLAFDRPAVLTGMEGVGPQGQARVYRLTAAGGQGPEEFVVPGASPLTFKIPPSAADGGGASVECDVQVPGGRVIRPPGEGGPVSALGVWVSQEASEAPAVMTCGPAGRGE